MLLDHADIIMITHCDGIIFS